MRLLLLVFMLFSFGLGETIHINIANDTFYRDIPEDKDSLVELVKSLANMVNESNSTIDSMGNVYNKGYDSLGSEIDKLDSLNEYNRILLKQMRDSIDIISNKSTKISEKTNTIIDKESTVEKRVFKVGALLDCKYSEVNNGTISTSLVPLFNINNLLIGPTIGISLNTTNTANMYSTYGIIVGSWLGF